MAETLAQCKHIPRLHKLRGEFSDCSTGNDQGEYYKNKSFAINAFDARLQTYDLCLSRDAWVDYNGNTGCVNHPVVNEFEKQVGCAIFSWHRMDSGRYEFIGYLA